ncbi:PAS domain S-box protein [Skermanella mucosa]|uniref:PAS domain S-box protein n=1 Tax=Skermanella mucosa TaxID=1789672 RepID=UPI00192B2006|nr:PAS domain S-box protein [Skermanella mucosa]UEM21523.1 PAS domain S-box protein [Skermanella mucosa]
MPQRAASPVGSTVPRAAAALAAALMLSACLLVASLGSAWAQNAARTVMLVNELEVYALGRDMELFEDPTGRLTIDQVATPEFSHRFRPGREDEPNFGLTRSAVWARVTLNSILAVHRDWFLVFREALVDRVTVYVPRPDGGWTALEGGMLASRSYFRLAHRYPVFPLWLQPTEQPTLYVRVENRGALTIPLVIQSVASLYTSDRSEQLLFGTLFGILMTVCVYLFFIWRVMRERCQLYLILMQLSVTFYIASANGFLAEYLWRGMPWWTGYSVPLSILLAMITGILFADSFLAVRRHMPTFYRVLRLLVLGLACLAVLAAFDRLLVNRLLPWCVIGMVAVFLHAGVGAIRLKVDGGPVFLVAFSALLGGGLARSLVSLDLLPANLLTSNMFDAGAAVSSVVFAVGIAGQFRTRQEEKERALRLSNERFALAADGASAGLYDWDLVTGAVYYSPRMAELYGGPADDLGTSAEAWTRQIHPADATRVRRAYRAFLKSRSNTVALEYRLLSRDGRMRWVSTTGAAVRDPRTNWVLRVAGSTADITENKRAEESLRASESLKAAVIASSLDCIITSDAEGRIIEFNPAAEQTFGHDRDSVLGRPLGDIIMPVLQRARHTAGMRHYFDTRERHLLGRRVEVEAMRSDGTVFPVELAVNEVKAGGQAVFTAFVRDITERRRAQAQIASQREALVQSEKLAALGSLLAGVAHELNNPLSVVVGQSVLLEETAPDDPTAQRARKIHRAADRCARIVKTFLSLARRSPPERQEVDLNEIVLAAVELVGYSLRTDGIELALALSPAPARLWGDADQLNQVVTNLVVNARQALQGAPGPRRLEVSVVRVPGPPVIRLTVADNGPGVPAGIRTRIFDPFFTTKPAGIGTGVGLSMCHNIIDSHGGTITLGETPGGGATFTVELPARDPAPAPAPEPPQAPATVRSLNLLIVDDDPEIALTLAEMLQPDGHCIAVAQNGMEALERLASEPCDLVISDIRMPELDGPGLYRELETRHPGLLKRIVFVTGDTLGDGVRDFLGETGVPVLEKPYEPADLRAVVARLVGEP